MKFLVCLALLVVPALALVQLTDQEVNDAFVSWMARHNKAYATTEEFNLRREIFSQNIDHVNDLNAKHMLIGGDAVFGLTKFSDMSKAEFKAKMLTAKPRPVVNAITLPVNPNAPNDVDWRNQGAVTDVKDQGQCGSCWAFSATEAAESYFFLDKQGGLPTLSPQQVVSCDPYDYGCNGGWPYDAFTYLKGAGGQESESAYPYTSGGGDTGTCQFDGSDIVARVSGYQSVTGGEAGLASALGAGPPSVCVAAEDWYSYTGGVLRSCSGGVDHCVQAVGYTSDYWIVRNSWGSSWGEAGYIFIARGSDLCLIADYVTYPTY
jgi:hypothetical protein